MIKCKTRNIIIKIEQRTIVYAQWDKWTSFDVIKHHMVTTDVTKRHFKVRICEHLGIWHLSEKKVKVGNNKLTAIQEHLLCCSYSPSFEDFSILTRESNDFKQKIMENLLIARDKPILNKADSSLPLELF